MKKSELKTKLEASIDYLKRELSQIRTGRVTPSMLDDVSVTAYDSKMSIKELGTISVLDAHTLQITPWDKSVLEPIANGIINSDLNLNPVVKDTVVIVPVPSLTQERRSEFVKVANEKTESCRTSIRSIRQEAMKNIETDFSNKEFGEDEKYSKRDEVEKIVKEYVKIVEDLTEEKKKDLLEL